MKKITVIVLVLLAVLVLAPWGIGRVAEQRINAGLDQLTEKAPYLTIVERKWTRGWFRSEQQITVELFGSMSPLRFTVRNEILHGPVLWPASLGIARVNSRFEMSEAIRQKIIETFGTDEPVRLSTRVGFFGGGTTRLSGDGRTIRLNPGSLSYEPFKVDVSYAHNLDSVDIDGSWPGFQGDDPARNEKVHFKGITLTARNQRVRGDLYDADAKFMVDEIRVTGADEAETIVENLRYVVTTRIKDDFMEATAKMGTGKVRNKALTELQFNLDEVHYDFSVHRIHAPTLEKIMADLKKVYTEPVVATSTVEQAVLAPFKQRATELLTYDPEFVIDRVGIVTPEGQGNIKGVLHLKGATAQDFEAGSVALIGKLEADINIDVAQKLLEKLPSGATGAGMAIDMGYARRDGDKLVSHIEFRNGGLKINGKDQALPPMGGPPARVRGMPPPGEEPAVPQE